jgi:hypothetical protein
MERGFICGEMVVEDWGCYLPVEIDGKRLGLSCSGRPHDIGPGHELIVVTDPPHPKAWRWFRKVDFTPQLKVLTAAVAAILGADADIHDIAWDDAD